MTPWKKLGRSFGIEQSKGAMNALKELSTVATADKNTEDFQSKLFAFFKYIKTGLDNDFFTIKEGFEAEIANMLTNQDDYHLLFQHQSVVGCINGNQRVPNLIGGTTYIEVWEDSLLIEITDSYRDMWTLGYKIDRKDNNRIVIEDDKS